MLQSCFRPQIDRALAAVGGDYFCGLSYTGTDECGELSFTIQTPTPLDKGIIDGLERSSVPSLRGRPGSRGTCRSTSSCSR